MKTSITRRALLHSSAMLSAVAMFSNRSLLRAQDAAAAAPLALTKGNSAKDLNELGLQFLSRTYIGTWDDQDFDRGGRWLQLKAVRADMDKGNYAAALETFKRYTLQKLCSIDAYGLPKARFDPFSAGIPAAQWIRPLIQPEQHDRTLKTADKLMAGTLIAGGKQIKIGAPGQIPWKDVSAAAERGATGWPWDIGAFDSLLAAYILTGQQSYLDTWAAYADDWAVNQHYGVSVTPVAYLPDHWSEGAQNQLLLLSYLGGVASQPNGPEVFPAGTFARVFLRLIDDYVPTSIIYHRACPQNWTDASLVSLVDLGFFLDEYPIGAQLIHESRRRVELLTPTHHLMDGPDLDSTVGYDGQYIMGASTMLDRMKTRQIRIPDTMLPSWERSELRGRFDLGRWMAGIQEEMWKRGRFLVAHTMSNGEWPIGGARNDRRNRGRGTYDWLAFAVPDIFRTPDLDRILDIGSGRSLKPVPSFTSERFPFSGFTYIRSGWKPTDPYVFMYCSPWPVGGSLGQRNNNAIGLGGYGCDLLATGENGTYDEPRTPVRVEGEDQFFTFGIPKWGHRGPMLTTSHYLTPPAWRCHNSPRFNVAEGIYAGAFGKTKPIFGVSHQRIVHFVREAGFWIVTDRLRSRDSHVYTLDWRFGIQPGHPSDFTDDQIKVEASNSAIKTTRAGGANISLYHFSSQPLTFSTGEERTPPANHYRIHDFFRVSADWKARDESVVVTAVFPRKTDKVELDGIKSISLKDASGFEATTPDGSHIAYLAANQGRAAMALGNIRASCESLLVVTDLHQKVTGIALGCESFSNGNKKLPDVPSDFEFALVDGKVGTTAIHTPVDPVRILPEITNGFFGSQLVTLVCATPEVEIHYTLDGTNPTAASPAYSQPFTITENTQVKARAFRGGVTGAPVTMDETTASLVTKAEFSALKLTSSTRIASTAPGLQYDYYEGRWQELLSGLDRLKPVKSGHVTKLFDIRAKGLASTFAFRYTGYLNVPVDGVYIFHAPSEFYEPNIMSGYELRVYLDHQEWYPATSRHALGNWAVGLQKGLHPFSVVYADLRDDAVAKMNKPGLRPLIWTGTVPNVEVSGPNIERRPIPAAWLAR